MAPPAGTLRVGRYFLALLALVALLYAIVFWPGQRHTPKLGLDLVGGTQVIFTAKTDNGSAPSSSSMEQAKQIIQERVNGTGVTEATVVIQGTNQLVVSIPGSSSTDVSKLGAAAVLNFRGLVAPAAQVACISPTAAPSSTASSAPSGGASSSGAAAKQTPSSANTGAAHSQRLLTKAPAASGTTQPKASATPKASTTAATSATPSATPSASASTQPTPNCSANVIAAVAKAGKFTVPLSEAAFNKLSSTQQQLLAAGLAQFDCASGQNEKDIPTSYFVGCDSSGLAYLLGPVIVAGKQIADASSVAPNISSGQTQWTVSLDLKPSGQSKWASYTSAHNVNGATAAVGPNGCSASTTPCADFVGFTLDGAVISAPYNENAINGGTTSITGQFTPASSKDLANKLKYGALPLSFRAEEAQTVSATLGTSQLKSGLLAGGIGLVLVVIYTMIYYRALGLVTISSLLVSGALTYGSLVMLATQIGFTLSLAGIAGFIVAVGITADSFVVFFERIKDEVHEGRSVRVAIPRAWVRARRTILSADTVSFLAAAILYYFAAGDVKGFAFTLGLSTILDLVVVFLFTHPLVSYLSQFRTFGSARFSGLDAVRGGPAISDVEPARTSGARSRSRGGAPQRRPSTVALLDVEESEADPGYDVGPDEPERSQPTDGSVTGPTTNEDTPAADETSIEVTEADEPSAPRRRSVPEPGSAAERAAARRARLREQRPKDEGQS